MNPQLYRILNALTQIFHRDPGAYPVLRVFREPHTPPPEPQVILDNHILTIGPHSWDLRLYTIGRLTEIINATPGILANILDTRYSKLLAGALNGGVNTVTPVNLAMATNPLFQYLRPVAWEVEKHEGNIDIALAQLNVLTSTLYFADYWGATIGVVRKAGEPDAAYTQRIIDTILLKRENDLALEQLLKDEFNLDATTHDLLRDVLTVNIKPGFSKIPGMVYNAGNFIIECEMTQDDVLGLVNQHRAGGTQAFLRQLVSVGMIDATMPQADTYDISIFDAQLLPEQELAVTTGIDNEAVEINVGLPAWTVGVTPMPGSAIV